MKTRITKEDVLRFLQFVYKMKTTLTPSMLADYCKSDANMSQDFCGFIVNHSGLVGVTRTSKDVYIYSWEAKDKAKADIIPNLKMADIALVSYSVYKRKVNESYNSSKKSIQKMTGGQCTTQTEAKIYKLVERMRLEYADEKPVDTTFIGRACSDLAISADYVNLMQAMHVLWVYQKGKTLYMSYNKYANGISQALVVSRLLEAYREGGLSNQAYIKAMRLVGPEAGHALSYEPVMNRNTGKRTFDENAPKPTDTRVKWTPERVEQLTGMLEGGYKYGEIAAKMGTTYNAIACEVQYLRDKGKIKPSEQATEDKAQKTKEPPRVQDGRRNVHLNLQSGYDWTEERLRQLVAQYKAGESYKEIANSLGTTVKSVSCRLDRLIAKGKLRRIDKQPGRVAAPKTHDKNRLPRAAAIHEKSDMNGKYDSPEKHLLDQMMRARYSHNMDNEMLKLRATYGKAMYEQAQSIMDVYPEYARAVVEGKVSFQDAVTRSSVRADMQYVRGEEMSEAEITTLLDVRDRARRLYNQVADGTMTVGAAKSVVQSESHVADAQGQQVQPVERGQQTQPIPVIPRTKGENPIEYRESVQEEKKEEKKPGLFSRIRKFFNK